MGRVKVTMIKLPQRPQNLFSVIAPIFQNNQKIQAGYFFVPGPLGCYTWLRYNSGGGYNYKERACLKMITILVIAAVWADTAGIRRLVIMCEAEAQTHYLAPSIDHCAAGTKGRWMNKGKIRPLASWGQYARCTNKHWDFAFNSDQSSSNCSAPIQLLEYQM